MKFNHLYLIIFFSIVIFSCDLNYYSKSISLDDRIWSDKDTLVYEFEINDSVSTHEIGLNIRNNDTYKWSNLFIGIQIEMPENKKINDFVECILADSKGKWLGDGFGSIYTSYIIYRKNVIFPFKGKYRIKVFQTMRIEDSLEGLEDIGIFIKKK